jgi:hypothetical protein
MHRLLMALVELAAAILLCGAVALMVHWFIDAASWLAGLL